VAAMVCSDGDDAVAASLRRAWREGGRAKEENVKRRHPDEAHGRRGLMCVYHISPKGQVVPPCLPSSVPPFLPSFLYAGAQFPLLFTPFS